MVKPRLFASIRAPNRMSCQNVSNGESPERVGSYRL
jgi:hypothetical protein